MADPAVLADWEYELGGVVFGCSQPYLVSKVEGLGVPPVRLDLNDGAAHPRRGVGMWNRGRMDIRYNPNVFAGARRLHAALLRSDRDRIDGEWTRLEKAGDLGPALMVLLAAMVGVLEDAFGAEARDAVLERLDHAETIHGHRGERRAAETGDGDTSGVEGVPFPRD